MAIQFATNAIEQADAQVAKTFFAIQWNYILLFAPPLIALTLAASIIAIRDRALPQWLGWVGVVVALFLLMPWVGVFIFLGWTLLTSVVLLLKTTTWEKNVR